MKSFFAFLKRFTKAIIIFSVVFFLIIFSAIFVYEQLKKNQHLKERLKELESQNAQIVSTPEQFYAESRHHIKNREYDAALTKLMQLKSSYPFWHPNMINKSIEAVRNLKQQINQTQSELEQKLDRFVSVDSPDNDDPDKNVSDEVAIVDDRTTITHKKNFSFRKFEYSDNKLPLRTSNSGYKRNVPPGERKNIKINPDGSITASANDFEFKKFEFEDKRYKKNIRPVKESGTKISDPNKAVDKQSTGRTYDSVPAVNSRTDTSAKKDSNKTKK